MAAPEITRASERADGEVWRWAKVSAVDPRKWHWANFTPAEMACRKTGVVMIRPSFMDELQVMRNRLNVPMVITSGYRSPEHNAAVSSTRTLEGPHVSAQAVDVAVKFGDAFTLVDLAIQMGFTGIGLRQHGNLNKRFVHIDKWEERVTARLWTYDQVHHG